MKRMTGSWTDKCKYIMSFGPDYALASIRCLVTKNSIRSLEYRKSIILKYLRKKYGHIIRKYAQEDVVIPDERLKPDIKEPIWVMWLQGADLMPEIVRLCQKSKERYAGEHQVIVLDKNNLRDYVTLPDNLWQMLNTGEITLQHFSDITRVKLLRDYGGFWMDVTFFCTESLDDRWFKMPFFSVKQEYDPTEHWFASQRRWIGGAVCAQRGGLLFSFLHDLQLEFFTKEKNLIDYLVMDYMIILAYNSFPEVKKLIDAVEYTKGDCYYLYKHLGATVDNELLSDIENHQAFINKLGWRTDTSVFSEGSLYQYLKSEYGIK